MIEKKTLLSGLQIFDHLNNTIIMSKELEKKTKMISILCDPFQCIPKTYDNRVTEIRTVERNNS